MTHRWSSRRWQVAGLALLVAVAAATLTAPAQAEAATGWGSSEEAGWSDASALSSSYTPAQYPGSMYWVAQEITGAGEYWNDGFTGAGVDVAVIDTGVVPVEGLATAGKIVNGPDLSFESQSDTRQHLDTYGHGTHMAGIIAGRDTSVTTVQKGDERFLGMAPDARIVSLKVGDYQGSVDVSQVIAAIDWVVQHKNDNGLNIRVLNLSFGTDSTQSYLVDPLAYAVERAWAAGIVVVVASGNDGNQSLLRNPAISPYVVAVGASASNMTYDVSDDQLAAFSACGTASRHVDLVAPGVSVVSLRNPGSYADMEHPEAVVENRFFLGSGTSQAAAVVSGAAALVVSQRPDITPDQVKKLLTDTAQPLSGVSTECQGAGLVDLKVARDARTPRTNQAEQSYPASDGTGSLDAARGSIYVESDGLALRGEQDIMGAPWNGWVTTSCWQEGKGKNKRTVCGDVPTTTLWDGGDWNGTTWSGTTWSGLSWSGVTWSGTTWSGISWSGTTWSDNAWTGTTWSGTTWSGTTWSGTTWSGISWSGQTWG